MVCWVSLAGSWHTEAVLWLLGRGTSGHTEHHPVFFCQAGIILPLPTWKRFKCTMDPPWLPSQAPHSYTLDSWRVINTISTYSHPNSTKCLILVNKRAVALKKTGNKNLLLESLIQIENSGQFSCIHTQINFCVSVPSSEMLFWLELRFGDRPPLRLMAQRFWCWKDGISSACFLWWHLWNKMWPNSFSSMKKHSLDTEERNINLHLCPSYDVLLGVHMMLVVQEQTWRIRFIENVGFLKQNWNYLTFCQWNCCWCK